MSPTVQVRTRTYVFGLQLGNLLLREASTLRNKIHLQTFRFHVASDFYTFLSLEMVL